MGIKAGLKVSIPYGAIKSLKACYSRRKLNLFQFLTVRLKALKKKWPQESMMQVSIPYGAIKSLNQRKRLRAK